MITLQARELQSPPRSLVVLGSTGSIGRNTLDIVRRFPDRFRVVGLAAGENTGLMLEQVLRFKPRWVSVLREQGAEWLRDRVPESVRVVQGNSGAVDIACMEEADLVISAMVGAAGLRPTFEAVRAGKHVALANKETLVMAGGLFIEEARRKGVSIFPIDSEHSAILQCIMGHDHVEVRRILLTASGGPLWKTPASKLSQVGPEQALAHPTWKMGPKISIDSSTLMNKGLEAIEAKWLFNVPMDSIDVHIHPQSIVHSMVEFCDGSVVGQLGVPDMRIPIAYALSYPERLDLGLPGLDLFAAGPLTFERPDMERFPCLGLAFEAGKAGGTMPAVLNAANEVAVSLFLDSKIAFTEIPDLIEKTMAKHTVRDVLRLSDALDADRWARDTAIRIVSKAH